MFNNLSLAMKIFVIFLVILAGQMITLIIGKVNMLILLISLFVLINGSYYIYSLVKQQRENIM